MKTQRERQTLCNDESRESSTFELFTSTFVVVFLPPTNEWMIFYFFTDLSSIHIGEHTACKTPNKDEKINLEKLIIPIF
jgi:hypothetical protein